MKKSCSFSDILPKFQLKQTFHSNIKNTDLDKAIKKHHVRNFIKNAVPNLNKKFATEVQQQQQQQQYGLENHLDQLKKSCSIVIGQIKQKEVQGNKFRDSFQQCQQKSSQIRNSRKWQKERMAQLEKKLKQLNAKKEITAETSQSYQYIIERMKKDGLIHHQKQNNMTKRVQKLQKTIFMMEHQLSNLTEIQKMSSMGVRDGFHQLQQLNCYREKNRSDAGKQSQVKIEQANKLKEKQKQTEKIQELAADNIQDADIIKLQKYMLSQLFLRQLLKQKMVKTKDYFKLNETSFFKIKSNTTVKDAGSLRSQFFNFESTYSEKTHWVKHLEEQLNFQQQQRKQLKQKMTALQMQEIQLMQIMENQSKFNQNINIEQLNNKYLEAQLCLEQIQGWVKTQCSRLKGNVQDENIESFFQELLIKINNAK